MHKQYTRLRQINLPDASKASGDLKILIKKRMSSRDFSGKPISMRDLSNILYYSAGVVRPNPFENDNPFRAYPSAGAKYPLEVYPLVLKSKDIKKGLYHYNPSEHSLEILLQPVRDKEIEGIWTKQKWFRKASVIIFLTSVFGRTTDKYGGGGIKFPYLEAGHLVQNTYLIATSLNIGCCAIGLLQEDAVIKLLDINPREEYPIYYVALGT